jgi:Ca2+/Na+ antiporter
MPTLLIVNLCIVLVLSAFMSYITRNGKKKDKGFILSYYELSHRRKVIRTLWELPFLILLLTLMFFFTDIETIYMLSLSALLFLLFIGQFCYNYYKWKQKEKA